MKTGGPLKIGSATAALLSFIAIPAAADEVAEFYKDKTLTMVISSGVGGGYDAFSRTLSRHMGKHIPGNPRFINTNRVGAGGIVAKKGFDKIKVIETKLVRHMGEVTQILRKGRQIVFRHNGQETKAKVSGSRTKITIDGKKAKRGALKPGMTCAVNYPGPGEEAKNIDCRS